MPQEKEPIQPYDIIICGAGCAGLSLAMRLIDSGKFSGKKILLADQNFKKSNDRTWCFWEKENGFFDQIVFRKWEKLWFYSDRYSTLKDIRPYKYKMIRGSDFYAYCLDIIRSQPNIDLLEEKIDAVHSDTSETYLIAGGEKIRGHYIFNSIFFSPPVRDKKDYWLLQHFKGWVVETPNKAFHPDEAVLMDFRVSQEQGTAFVYTMPFSETCALIEYTFFTKKVLEDSEYDDLLKAYLNSLPGTEGYTILEKEFGVIPMTTHRFPEVDHHIFNIGMAGGKTRASTGYTFQFIQKQTAEILSQLIQNKTPSPKNMKGRFRYYDRLFLDVLSTSGTASSHIFSHLFCMNSAKSIFDFLDAESSVTQDFLVISSLPKKPFMRSAMRVLFGVGR